MENPSTREIRARATCDHVYKFMQLWKGTLRQAAGSLVQISRNMLNKSAHHAWLTWQQVGFERSDQDFSLTAHR